MVTQTAIPDLSPFTEFLDTVKKCTNETQVREAFVALAANGFTDSQFARSCLSIGGKV
jgi:hypothetical protein